jgi:uncharacterized membrane protein YfcA
MAYAAIGLMAGLLGSLVGAGGGFFMVPLQVMWPKAPQRVAQANSLAAIPPLALAGALVYGLAGERSNIDFWFALELGLGAMGGGFAGARIASRLRERRLKMVAAAILAVVGVKQIIAP